MHFDQLLMEISLRVVTKGNFEIIQVHVAKQKVDVATVDYRM